MAFGVLFDFTGNSNVSRITKTADLVKQQWFRDAVNYTQPIDLFVVIGHNPIRPSAPTSTFGTLYNTIRGIRPDVPIQAFGGHTHIRDFFVYDDKTTGLESGCDAQFDLPSGLRATSDITEARKELVLQKLFGCAPLTYCQYCQPFGAPGNIYTLMETALATVVVNETRKDIPRLILVNIGSIRFDLPKGPFTLDDSYIVSPFNDAFQFIPDVPYDTAKQVQGILNAGPAQKRGLSQDFGFGQMPLQDSCVDPPISHDHITGKSYAGGRLLRRQNDQLFPGYATTDDFGTDGDDTPHTKIPFFTQPNDVQANASFPTDGSDPKTVDLVFLDFIASYVLRALKGIGANYTMADVLYYLPKDFTTNSYLPAYAKVAWQENMPNCPVGIGIGS
ncbi:hypothetical protein GP486_003469 [Trichoglossum hirsutum]|uniref:Putative 5'-nucleotidase C-terminal domain-containing protein n=1 Tax=Trichoglossum hirsutum TaxID=265104 RepID=A0A9P8LD04_9PEZI|nr:hypothetical protein GP486_003469 [Trichoglossum hirsutum]